MMIVFVYDTQCCNAEEDDPADAVLYFHPGWVSDTQRHALAGQVVGTTHCVKTLFSQPTAITLQSGKFIIREYGRYILAIGSDRNIPDWVLKNRATLLTSMIKVYHGDLAAVAALFPGERNPRLAEKLYQMLETYLPVLQFGCHIFQRVPMLNLPKSATSIYMEAMQILEQCRKQKGVLGGVILYNNKIVATQLTPSLTSYITVVDPYRIKSPAENLETQTPLPLGSQLLVVYISKKIYEHLKNQSDKMQQFSQEGEEMINKFKKSQEAEREKSRDFPISGMKRDKSLLFTAVPEEDHNLISPPSSSDQGLSDVKLKQPQVMPDVVPFTNKPRQRPTKLSLSFKTQKSLDEEEVKENFEKPFMGQTSVCSTPMVEYKRLHGNVLSICQNPDSQLINSDKSCSINAEPDVLKNIENSAKMNIIENEKRDNKMVLDFNCIGDHYINKPAPMRKLASVTDLQETIKKLSTKATSKLKFKRMKPEVNDFSPSPERIIEKKRANMTINDPSFPVFRNDGVAISESLFNQYLEQHYADMKESDSSKEDNMFTFNMKLCEQEKFEGFDSEMTKSPQRTPKKISKESVKTTHTDQSRRKDLSLPLKSLTESSDSQVGSESEVPGFKKKLSGVQLTPLMEKLSHLAFSDKSSGYSSRVMTPLELRDFPTPSAEKQVTFVGKSKPHHSDSSTEDEYEDIDSLPTYSSNAVRTALFVSGLQSMALMVLVELQAADDSELINSLWETSLNALGPIEQKCMEPLPTSNDASDYSYLTLDPDWGTVMKGGPWASLDIATMGLIHSEFAEDKQMTELILRSEDSAVVGWSCGGAEVYYQESGPRAAGPPAPSDALAAAPLRARRRLHRDHSLVLL
ncbi:Hermansky-Pudlak syndrome 4 protein [Eumeta japonica]|uniref:Hermansky-Pudlak syndrome 4 protein n=1 Tax=Eumeta variegata TaxID=151549 RepID=A0A4C1WDH4_EUMVA|nr:Hermansky-Pudlak syndrome 4 protein [Eumeta japonica]